MRQSGTGLTRVGFLPFVLIAFCGRTSLDTFQAPGSATCPPQCGPLVDGDQPTDAYDAAMAIDLPMVSGCGAAMCDASVPPDTGASVGCGSEPTCPAGFVCAEGSCLPTVSSCQSIADCPVGSLCLDGVCSSGLDSCTGDPSYFCLGGEQCVAGHCQAAGLPCAIDSDCPNSFVCVLGVCTPKSICTFDGDCSQGYVCVAGQCVFAPWCRSDFDCPKDEACVGGACVIATGIGCVAKNYKGYGCPDGFVCTVINCLDEPCAGVCVAQPQCLPNGSQWQSPMPCPTDEVCVQGVCISRNQPWSCHDDGECAPGQHCEDGSCVVSCVTDAQCAAGTICIFGRCTTPTPCAIDADCEAMEVCISGVCRSAIECLQDSD